jgi:DNA repair exonuclease SbcCD ATPase subunit
MGTERTWKRQYVFLYTVCYLILIIGNMGCANFRTIMSLNDLKEAERYLESGDYVSAMEMNERASLHVLSFQEDNVLYQRGLILVDPRNPRRDYKRGKESFLKLIGEYSTSPLRNEARAWVAVIEEIERDEVKIQSIQLEVSALREELEEKKHQLDEGQNSLKEKDEQLVTLQDQLQESQAELKKLRGQIEKLKEIDLNIDTIKREALPQ